MVTVYMPEKIHKIIVKISGEILGGKHGHGYDLDTINTIIDEIVAVKNQGYSIGVVLGGGNIFRGASNLGDKLNRYTADNIGMLATIQNALVLSELLRKRNHRTEIFSAIQINKVAKFYTPNRANTSLNEGKICFFCAGTGNPYFTTDTAAVLRAIELKADAVFKGTKVDGVYSADPVNNKDAELFTNVTFDEVLAKQLKVMDMTSFSLAREFNMPIKVFNINKKNNLIEAILSKDVGTYIHQ
ncbi:UMP kinase [Candidatus Cloacimonadota bacterium]